MPVGIWLESEIEAVLVKLLWDGAIVSDRGVRGCIEVVIVPDPDFGVVN